MIDTRLMAKSMVARRWIVPYIRKYDQPNMTMICMYALAVYANSQQTSMYEVYKNAAYTLEWGKMNCTMYYTIYTDNPIIDL